MIPGDFLFLHETVSVKSQVGSDSSYGFTSFG